MRVWIINHYAIPPSMGGLVRHYYFSKFLREDGHQVRIFTASEIHNTNINMIRDGALYSEEPPKTEAAPLRAVPYYAWGNRGGGEMRVWIRE